MSFLDTIGMEIEGSGLERGELTSYLQTKFGGDFKHLFSIGRDASVESQAKWISKTIKILNHDTIAHRCTNQGIIDPVVLGYEIVTVPLEFQDLERTIERLLPALITKGEIVSPRSSIHVHVGFGHSFPLLRSSFALGLTIEPLMYKLAGMGSLFRGHVNNSIYCRPLELSVAVKGNDEKFYSLLNSDYIFDTSNVAEFWQRYAIHPSEFEGGVNRYHPARYFGFNLLAIPLHRTVEFRYFNTSFNASWVLAIARFCQSVAELSSKLNASQVQSLEKSLYKNNRKSITERFTDSDYHLMLDKLEHMFDKMELNFNTDRAQRRRLRDIIEASQTPEFLDKMPRTHIKQFELSVDDLLTGLHPPVSDTVNSGYLDIHNIGDALFSMGLSEDN